MQRLISRRMSDSRAWDDDARYIWWRVGPDDRLGDLPPKTEPLTSRGVQPAVRGSVVSRVRRSLGHLYGNPVDGGGASNVGRLHDANHAARCASGSDSHRGSVTYRYRGQATAMPGSVRIDRASAFDPLVQYVSTGHRRPAGKLLDAKRHLEAGIRMGGSAALLEVEMRCEETPMRAGSVSVARR